MVTRSRAGLPAGSTLLQTRERGIPPGSFRKMSAGDQQKVLDEALATERGITSKRHSARGSKVDMDVVKSDGYAAKFSKLDMPVFHNN